MKFLGIIYGLVDPSSGEIRYVGQTMRRIEERVSQHLAAAKAGKLAYSARWIRKLLARGLEPEVLILEEAAPGNELDDAEIRWILRGKERGWKLTNLTSGGMDSPMRIPEIADRAHKSSRMTRQLAPYRKLRSRISKKLWADPEHRRRMVEAHRGQKPVGKGARGRLANPLEKNPMSDPAIVEKVRQSNIGKKASDATKAKMRIAQRTRREGERMLRGAICQ